MRTTIKFCTLILSMLVAICVPINSLHAKTLLNCYSEVSGLKLEHQIFIDENQKYVLFHAGNRSGKNYERKITVRGHLDGKPTGKNEVLDEGIDIVLNSEVQLSAVSSSVLPDGGLFSSIFMLRKDTMTFAYARVEPMVTSKQTAERLAYSVRIQGKCSGTLKN